MAPQDEIQAAAAPVVPVSPTNGGDIRGMARGREPVVNRGADLAALDRWLAGAVVAGNQQHQPVARGNGSLKAGVDCAPGGVEVHAVKVEHAVGPDLALAQPLVPAAVERFANSASRRRNGWLGA